MKGYRHNCDKVRTSTNGPTYHGMVHGRVSKDHGATNVTKASPGGTAGGTPSSKAVRAGGNERSGKGRMADGYPTQNGYIGW